MPYCLKDTDLEQYINKYNSCLKSENGDASLKRKHAYYYQTQQQIFTAGKPYCDLVVCAFKEQIDLFCKRILPDVSHWYSVVSKLTYLLLEIPCATRNSGKVVYSKVIT